MLGSGHGGHRTHSPGDRQRAGLWNCPRTNRVELGQQKTEGGGSQRVSLLGRRGGKRGGSGDQPALVKKEGGGRSCLGERSCWGLKVSSLEEALQCWALPTPITPPTSCASRFRGSPHPAPAAMTSFCLLLWFLFPPSVQAAPSTSSAVSQLQLLPVSTRAPCRAVGNLPPTLDSELSPKWLEGFSALHSVLTAQRQSRPGSRPLPGSPWLVHPPWL